MNAGGGNKIFRIYLKFRFFWYITCYGLCKENRDGWSKQALKNPIFDQKVDETQKIRKLKHYFFQICEID